MTDDDRLIVTNNSVIPEDTRSPFFYVTWFVVSMCFIMLAVMFSKGDLKAESYSPPLMIIGYEGGLCSTGELCSSEVFLNSDGSTSDKKISFNSAQMETLKSLITYSDLNSIPLNVEPQCSSFVDGQDLVLSFPQKYGDKKFIPCMLEEPQNDPLLAYVQQELSLMGSVGDEQ